MLLGEARARGVSPDALLCNAMKEFLAKTEARLLAEPQMSPQERASAFAEWARSHRQTPPLSDEAISRESIYGDSG